MGETFSGLGFNSISRDFSSLLNGSTEGLMGFRDSLSTIRGFGNHIELGEQFKTIGEFDSKFQGILGRYFSEGPFSGRASLFSFDSRFGFGERNFDSRFGFGERNFERDHMMGNDPSLVMSASDDRARKMFTSGVIQGITGLGGVGSVNIKVGIAIGTTAGVIAAYNEYTAHPLTKHENKFKNQRKREDKQHQENIQKIETEHAHSHQQADQQYNKNLDTINAKNNKSLDTIDAKIEQAKNFEVVSDPKKFESEKEEKEKANAQAERDRDKKAADERRKKASEEEKERHEDKKRELDERQKEEKQKLDDQYGKPCQPDICDDGFKRPMICKGFVCREQTVQEERAFKLSLITRPPNDEDGGIHKFGILWRDRLDYHDNITRWEAPSDRRKMCYYGNPVARN